MKLPYTRSLLVLILVSFAGIGAFAQRGKHGVKTVTTGTVVVNEYTALSSDAAAGATTINVTASTLNGTGRFPANLAAGDLIMIIQMQGATINGAPQAGNPPSTPADSTWGSITNYNNCGNWEFGEVIAVPNGTSITLQCPLTYSYTAAGRAQVVRVQRYSSLTVNAGAGISSDPWNGTIGGICAIEVENNTTMNGSINVSGNGFRGGQIDAGGSVLMNLFFSASTLGQDGAEKGEGIAGYKADYDPFGGRYMRGAGANAGGGGNIHDAGGGGGANGGNPASWNGHGNPDNSVAGYSNAWNLQYAGFSTQTSSGGGQGGYAWSSANLDPTVVGPCDPSWGGQWRCAVGGYGGRPLDYTTGRLFLGGGGGAGDQSDGEAGGGGKGGGLIYLMNYGLVTGAGSLVSNGNNGSNTTGATTFSNHRDGAGGAGAGGTIIVNSVGAITGISLTANGGNGGNQLITAQQAEGPGGGGSGGYIGVSNGTPTMNVNGGANGTTSSTGVNQFPPNGATKGGAGTSGAVLMNNVVVSAPNVTICAGQPATLNGALSGNPAPGTTVIWYDAQVGGNVLPSTGGSLTTSVIATPGTYTFYVGSCPGTYHQPVTVTATTAAVITMGPNVTICNGGSTTLSAGGGSNYTWSPATGLSSTTIANPVANPSATTTYTVSGTTPCGPTTGTVMVTVNSNITANIAGNTTICTGGNTTLTASGGSTFSWNTGASTSAITVSPTTNTTYSVSTTSGACSATASVTVNVASAITASVTASTATVCPGTPVTLTASGGSIFSWSTGGSTAAITVNPTATSSYSVNVSSGTCNGSASVTVTVANNMSTSITGPTNICAGGTATLTASGSGTYQWSTAQSTSSIAVNPTGSTTYSVLVSAGTCTASASHTINVGANITALITAPDTICGGTSATLTASGGSTYVWNTGVSTASITVNPAASSVTSYTVIATSGTCGDTATFTLTTLPVLTASVTGTTPICQGTSATLNASMSDPSANAYAWNTGASTSSITVSPSVTTTYSVTGSAGNCSSGATFTVTVVPQASLTVSPNATICSGQSVALSASGGSQYVWSNGSSASSITVSPGSNLTYTVIAGVAACSDTDSVSVTVLPSPTVTATTSTTTICAGNTVTLTASGGTNYAWSNGVSASSITVSPGTTTTYSVIAAAPGGCNDTSTVTITVSSLPGSGITGNSNICQGQTATLTAAPSGATYQWSSGQSTQSINPSTAGTYSVIITMGSCKDTVSINTVVAPNPTAVALADTTIISGTSANLSASGGSTYQWSNGMSGAGITVSPNSTTVYCVTVYDANNCIDTACVTVKVEECSKVLYLPNAFSPNGDLENDEWQIYYNIPECIVDFKLVVFNRWGEMVYKTHDERFKWNGEYKGWFTGKEPGGTEVYSYYMRAELMDGTRIDKKGNVSLVR